MFPRTFIIEQTFYFVKWFFNWGYHFFFISVRIKSELCGGDIMPIISGLIWNIINAIKALFGGGKRA